MRPLWALVNCIIIATISVVGSLVALTLRLFDRTGDNIVDLAKFWSRLVMGVSGVRLRVQTLAPIEPGKPYVFMANHTSALDIWALLVAIPQRIRMIAKKQLGRIPLFGWAMRAGRFIFIDRQNAIAARKSIEEAKARIRGGQSVLLFPEGTRTRDGKLGPFKKGGFHLAIDAGVAIVPVAVRGAGALMPRGKLWLRAGLVDVVIGEPIPTEGLTGADRNALVERVHAEIDRLLALPIA